jgi:hypothetical protein
MIVSEIIEADKNAILDLSDAVRWAIVEASGDKLKLLVSRQVP